MRPLSERSIIRRQSLHQQRWAARVGAAHVPVMMLLALSLISAGLYIYMVNRSAVEGYAIRSLERELKELKKINGELRVQEAEAQSLVRVEAGSVDLRMEKAEPTMTLPIPSNTNIVAIR